jgi:5'-AMP-activated protein kinase regulatory beta subunit
MKPKENEKGPSGGSSSSGSSSSGSGPPILPPHLLQVILNNPNVSSGDSTLLPQPNHVMLNHLYALSIKVSTIFCAPSLLLLVFTTCSIHPQDGVMVLSCTHRYRKKYVTTLLYKPI